jgi:hypothetical protein
MRRPGVGCAAVEPAGDAEDGDPGMFPTDLYKDLITH